MAQPRASTPRKATLGITKPLRALPRDFRETYIRLGWEGVGPHYGAQWKVIARWLAQAGGDDLRRERSQVTGRRIRPDLQSNKFHAVRPPGPNTCAGIWLKAFGGSYRLRLKPDDRDALGVSARDLQGRMTAARCIEIIRLALLGGGLAVIDRQLIDMTPSAVDHFMRLHVDHHPFGPLNHIADAVLACSIGGPPPQES